MSEMLYSERDVLEAPGRAHGKRRGLLVALTFISVLFVVLAHLVNAAAAAGAGDSDAVTLFLPAAMSGYFRGVEVNGGGISGRATVNGEAVEGLPIDLYFYDGNKWSAAKSTETDERSYYVFEDVDPLLPGEEYFVSFGPNSTNEDLVANWYGQIIDDYQENDRVLGGDFDLADFSLLSPDNGFEGKLPILFEWERRELPGESYRMVVIDLDEDFLWPTFDLGDVDSFELKLLAPDMLYNQQYAWYVEVYAGPDSFGESFMLNDIEFKPPSSGLSTTAGAAEGYPFETGRDGRGGRR